VIQGHALPPDFVLFWRAYPRKVGKPKALKAWQKLRPPLDRVLAALAWQVPSPDWLEAGGKYIPYPEAYLNAGRWDDEPVNLPNVDAKTLRAVSNSQAWLDSRNRKGTTTHEITARRPEVRSGHDQAPNALRERDDDQPDGPGDLLESLGGFVD
jgi:hypothetical protein